MDNDTLSSRLHQKLTFGSSVSLLALALGACGSDTADPGSTGHGGSGGTGGSGTDGAEGPVYALTTQVLGDEATDNASYVVLTKTLDSETTVTLRNAAVEIAGRALGAGPEGGKALFIASDIAPTVTRYDLTADGRLAGGSTISFLGRGITKFGEYGGQFQFISPVKAYWFDGPTAQVVVWDPSAMKMTGSISLAALAHEGEVLTFTASPVRRGTILYSFVGWRKGPEVPRRAAAIVVDTANDTATIVESDRCGYVRDGVLADDQMLYLATEVYGAAVNYLNEQNAAAPCLLRFDTTNNAFDGTFHVSLSSLFGGTAAGTLVVGPNQRSFLRVLDKSLFSEEITHPRVLASAPMWRWAKLEVGITPAASIIADAAPSSGSVLPFVLGDRWFSPVFIDGERTQFLELTAEGPASERAITVPGLVFSAVKLR
ncbi:MAG TPA: hypothetical protein VJT73_09045 [Polyangiaceae bacterium]|nr:hypothetical protein [Polyangiaceae bacterium]